MTASALAARVRRFVDGEVLPREAFLDAGGACAARTQDQLREAAQDQGIWGTHLPARLGGVGLTLTDHLLVAEQEGRSLHGPAVLGADAVLDARMLDRHANAVLRERYLAPLTAGEVFPSYGMTEPGRPGSDPGQMQTHAELAGGTWTVSGRKWFVSHGGDAAFTTVVARTEEPETPARGRYSMIVVPLDAPGVSRRRPLTVLGCPGGQYELHFDNVRVDEDHLLGERGAALRIAGERLGLGRTLRAMHWLGIAQRAFDLMCGRLRDRSSFGGPLADKQLMHQHVFEAHLAVVSARCAVRRAAGALDAGGTGAVEVGAAKVAAARAVQDVVDRAIQVHGAEGLSDDTPLSRMFRAARATRILDGPDEVHVTTVARRILRGFEQEGSHDFVDAGDSSA